MKHISKFNDMINEGWYDDLVNKLNINKKVKYDKEQDIRMFFVELLDLGFQESVTKGVCGEDHKIKERRIDYVTDELFLNYRFVYKLEYKLNEAKTAEIMSIIAPALYRLLDDDYSFNITEFIIREASTFPKVKTPKQVARISISIYNKKDVVPWHYIMTREQDSDVGLLRFEMPYIEDDDYEDDDFNV